MIDSIHNLSGDYLTVYSMIGIVVVSILMIFTSPNKKFTSFGRFWIVVICWGLFEFLLGKTGSESANIFRITFCPFAFLALYLSIKNDPQFIKTVIILFVVIFLDNSYLFFKYTLLSEMGGLSNLDEFGSQSNYVFWPLCAVPFIFLVEKKNWRWILLIFTVVMSIISLKRSAIIALLLMIPVIYGEKRKITANLFAYAIMVVIVVVVLNKLLSGYLDILCTRMGMISEDEGSGRIPIFLQVCNGIANLSLNDLIFGRGFGRIIETGFSNAHNDFLQTIYEYGLIGLCLYISLFVIIVKTNRSKKIKEGKFSKGYYMTLSIFIVMGLVSNLTVSFTFFIYLCAFWGIAEGYINSTLGHLNKQ